MPNNQYHGSKSIFLKYLYIVNPAAGKGKGNTAKNIIQEYHKNINTPFEIILSSAPKHATKIAKENSNSYSHIIAVGGDGTINEVINGIADAKDIFFSVLPIGTGNDLIKSMNFPNSLLESLEIIHTKNMNKVISADLGVIDFMDKDSEVVKSHYFANCLGIGFDAYVGFINSKNKKLSGVTSYVLAVLKALYRFKMINTTINFDNIEIKGKKLMLTVGKGISSGGGFYLTPNAILDDNFLDVSIFDKVSRLRLLQVLPKALINKLQNVRESTMYKTKSLHIKLKQPYYAHCDGEIISQQLESAKISCVENGLKLIIKK